ncbi:hypothetical protein CISG_03274 [Coccidioides immitis RMSCC 3703]|uniref:Riboflavin kinase n=1 Tax=Coccidioides immitis RMSCC 3703 TaxID=454286 RepID=A0A0J8QK72_COCIT|nr:hypothetical protein CISG_03274 [Coccidioides immitis RMSCC 3703]
MRPDTPRDPLAGPDSGPESPYPIRLSGPVIKGFGRGSKENTVRSVEIHILPHLSLQSSPSASPLSSTPTTPDPTSSPGDNSASKPPHTRHHFHHFPDFYGTPLNLLILGYIRPEYDYVSLEALVEDIRVDCEVAKRSLARRKYICFIQEGGDVDDEGTKEARKWLRTF